MPAYPADKYSRWLIYTFSISLGVIFTLILFYISWNNVLENKKRKISFDLNTLSQAIEHTILVSNNVINDLASYVRIHPQLADNEFRLYVSEILTHYPFIEGITLSLPSAEGSNSQFSIQETVFRQHDIFNRGTDMYSDPRLSRTLAELIMPGMPPVMSSVIRVDDQLYYVIHSLVLIEPETGDKSGRNLKGVISLFSDPEKYFGNISLPNNISLTLYSEYASIGRQLLFNRKARLPDPGGWQISQIEHANQIQLPASTIRLAMQRRIYWEEMDKGLFFIVLIIGTGITLLLVALIRSKDMQARELRDRNILIEKKVEEQTHELALARDKAIEASRLKSDFLASMSHEIRTPLNAIIGMSELLSDTSLGDEQKKYVSVFKRAGDTLLSLVNDILDLSKIEARQLELEQIPMSIVDVVEETVEIYALKAGDKSIELIPDIDLDMEDWRTGDPGRLRQILLNLVSNALKFTENGEIVVAARQAPDNPDRVIFSVHDTGIGIPQDKLESIFESFTQADSSTTRKYGGTGLGLTISKSLVELMQGTIRVESEQDKGSTFIINLMLPVNHTGVRPDKPYSAIEGKRILLATQNVTYRKIITDLLCRYGVAVGHVDNCEEIPSVLLNSEKYDLLIFDSNLDRSGSPDLIENLQRTRDGLRFLLMINPAELNRISNWIKGNGIDNYLVKPIKRHELLSQVENCFMEVTRPQASEQIPESEKESGSGKRILLVDDNADNRLLIRAFLKKTAFIIDEAENGAEAVDMFQQTKYDLVLMDVQMPVMDGHTATRKIRLWEQDNVQNSIPVVALTAHASREEIEKCIEAGCDSHLSKPVKKKVLFDTISNFLIG